MLLYLRVIEADVSQLGSILGDIGCVTLAKDLLFVKPVSNAIVDCSRFSVRSKLM